MQSAAKRFNPDGSAPASVGFGARSALKISKTHFEQVPVAAVKKILAQPGVQPDTLDRRGTNDPPVVKKPVRPPTRSHGRNFAS
jgi:hypothetical protein